MSLKALFYAYILGGITFIPLVVAGLIFFTIYTSVPLGDADVAKRNRGKLEAQSAEAGGSTSDVEDTEAPTVDTNDMPRTRKGWLTMRRTFEESNLDGGYVSVVRSFLDARSKDPKRSRPKDMWYVVLKGKVLYLYEDEEMTECEAAVELGGHDVVIYPEGLQDGELFAKRNAICLKPKPVGEQHMPSVTKEMKLSGDDVDGKAEQKSDNPRRQEIERERLLEVEKAKQAAREEALNPSTPWFIFVRSNIEMEDWYFALVHASDHPTKTPSLAPLLPVFLPEDMNYLVSTLDEQPDVIPTRWLNALIGRIFFSYYRTYTLEAYIIGRLMKKLYKVKRPNFLTEIAVTEVSVGNKAPTLSKPMLKELTKEGDAAMEVHFQFKGEFRITIEATANINIGTFKSYTVKLALAAVLKELEGNLLIKVKRPPSNRIWYAFTQTPRMVLEVEPIVSDRQITWGMILSTIESRLKEIIQESVVMPNMDDISFFDSLDHEHRGGIWQDASRRERSATVAPETMAADDTESTASAPAPTAPSPTVDETLGQVSQSAEELTAPPPSVLSETSGTLDEAAASEQAPRNKRRRSWFSSARSEGSTGTRKDIYFYQDHDEPEDGLPRGRSTESDKGSTGTSRSRSTPQDAEVPAANDRAPESEESSFLNFLQPQVPRRSSSQHSSRRDHTKSPSADSSKSAPDSNSATPRKISGTSTPSTPNSFMSTLKSRAGDKQALSNTAKEAMRKWGVNWGMRKESSGDDNSDHGSIADSIGSAIGSRLRPDSNFGVGTKARASYAEVRAAVAERKGRAGGDRSPSNTEDDSNLSRSPSPRTLPVPVPEGSRGKARATSNPWSGSELGPLEATHTASSYPESVAPSTSGTSASSSTSKRRSMGETSRTSSPSVSRTNTDGDAVMSNQSSKPIHVQQPKAKTMTIPGIHASHRGEIMSMGYAPPQPPSMASSEVKSSSIYRLFKSPASGDQPSSSSQSSQDSTSRQVAQGPKDSGSILAPPPTSPSPIVNVNTTAPSSPHQPLSPRVPPPLPPRSAPIPAPAVSRPPLSEPALQSTPPSAEETLKSIATKHELRRGSSENGSTGHTSDPTLSNAEGATATIAGAAGETVSDHSLEALGMPTTPLKALANPGPPLPPRRIQVPETRV